MDKDLENKRKHISIFVSYFKSLYATCLLEVVKSLLENGFAITIVLADGMPEDICEPFYSDNANIDIVSVSQALENGIRFSVFRNAFNRYKFFTDVYVWLNRVLHNLRFFRNHKSLEDDEDAVYNTFLTEGMLAYKIESDDIALATDEKTLMWIDYLSKQAKISKIYYCLELYWEDYLKQKTLHGKDRMECWFYEKACKVLHNVNLVIIQDEARWEVLRYYCDLPHNFPVAYLPVCIADYQIEMDIMDTPKILFYPSLIAPKRNCFELMKMLPQNRDDVQLVVHGNTANRDYLEELIRYSKKRSNIQLDISDMTYDELLNYHRRIWGVVLYYGDENNNDRLIANSCNKLVMALQAGKPIITIGNASLQKLCEEYECGVHLEEWTSEALEKALRQLDSRYEHYCKQARLCFEEKYDIRLFENDLYSQIERYTN